MREVAAEQEEVAVARKPEVMLGEAKVVLRKSQRQLPVGQEAVARSGLPAVAESKEAVAVKEAEAVATNDLRRALSAEAPAMLVTNVMQVILHD